jgi:DNA polymerase-3 subunit gamma/tau
MAQSPSASDRAASAETPAGQSGYQQAGYQVVARRYRPQRFDELVGQEHVARGLSGAIESGRVGHAYLFTGARGVGKTSAARIYAKALECTGGDGAEPCNECERCRAIAAGQDIDVVEVDAASNRGIDEIRQLRQNVAVRPARGRCKIYIIDEVHMLTREAFNALLKTLEEPPAHVKFVLCTTEPEKLPITILSRCQRFDFQTVDAPAIARRLEQIVAAEGANVSPEALTLIARRAAGSMRDSQSLLEQLLGAASGPIGVDDVHAIIGTGREEKVGAIVAAIAARDARAAIAAFDDALAGGADPGGVLEQVMAALRDALLSSVGCGPEHLRQGAGLGVDLAAFGREAGTTTLLAMLQIIDHALGRMRSSGHAAVLAEMAIVRLASLEDLDSLAEAVERVSADGAAGPGPAARAPAPARPQANAPRVAPAGNVPAGRPAPAGELPAGEREKKTTEREAGATAPGEPATLPHATAAAVLGAVPESPPAVTAATPDRPLPTESGSASASASEQDAAPHSPDVPAVDASGDLADPVSPDPAADPAADPLGLWQRAGEALTGLAADFAALATRGCWRDGLLEISLPATSGSAASFLRRPEVAAEMSRSLEACAGRAVRHGIVVEPAASADPTQPDGAAAAVERGRPAASQATLVREAVEHPLVSHARAVFDAAVRKVEPPRQRAATRPVVAAVADAARAADGREDERDHANDDDSGGGELTDADDGQGGGDG